MIHLILCNAIISILILHNILGSLKESYEDDEEILNGRQTQQYYDQMIAQINDKIAKAVERGQSPYAVYAANDDEESDWC